MIFAWVGVRFQLLVTSWCYKVAWSVIWSPPVRVKITPSGPIRGRKAKKVSSKPLKEVQSQFPTATNKPSFLQDQASQEESTHLFLTLTCAHCYSGSLTSFLARSLPFTASSWIVKWFPGIKAKISLSLNKEESPDLLEAFYTITQSLLITLCVVLYYYLHTNDFYIHISCSHLSQSPTSASLHLNVPLTPQTPCYPNWTYLFPSPHPQSNLLLILYFI